jgi:ABC-type multidrug transport system fused ATPase/permease subunit
VKGSKFGKSALFPIRYHPSRCRQKGDNLITIAVIVFGAAGIARAVLDLADLLTFLMCVAVLVDPIHRLVNFARLYQEGITGFDRFFEMLQMEPDMLDQARRASHPAQYLSDFQPYAREGRDSCLASDPKAL